jgi:hypothetical protein
MCASIAETRFHLIPLSNLLGSRDCFRLPLYNVHNYLDNFPWIDQKHPLSSKCLSQVLKPECLLLGFDSC